MDGYVTIGTELDTSMIDKQISLLEDKLEGLEEEYKILEESEPFEGQSEELIKLGNEINSTKNKLSKLNKEKEKLSGMTLSGIEGQVANIGKSVENVAKKIVKWGLAFIGVRSAISLVRQSFNTLSQYDKQLATDVEYIRYAIANALRPVIEWILNLVKQIMFYVGYIAKAWFGVDLYAKSSAKNFANANKNAKKLNKTMASFDEMNVVNDNSSSNAGGGTPSFDLSSPKDAPVPKWLDWIAKNKDIVLAALAGIAAGLIAIKLGASALMGLGIGLIIAGIVLLIQDIINFIKDPSWEGFANILRDLAIVLAGVAIAMIAVNATNPIGWIILAIAALVALVSAVIKYWDNIVAFTSGVIEAIKNFFVGLWESICNGVEFAWNFAIGILSLIGNWIYNNVIKPVTDFFSGMWNGMVNGAKWAWDGIKNIFASVANFFKKIFGDAWENVKKIFSTGGKIFSGITEGILNSFKKIVNVIIDGLNKVVAIPFNGINSAFNNLRSVDLWGWKPFDWVPQIKVPQIPRLAKGGIINNPGKGVYTGTAIAGEAGREFYMPLQDEQMLSMVGEAIGRYITINLTNITELDGRQIARKVEQIKQNNDFILNR